MAIFEIMLDMAAKKLPKITIKIQLFKKKSINSFINYLISIVLDLAIFS